MYTTEAPDTRAARVRAEGPIRLDEANRLFKTDGPTGHASVSTLIRWVVGGKKGTKLDAARIKGEWHTSYQAVQRFKQATGA